MINGSSLIASSVGSGALGKEHLTPCSITASLTILLMIYVLKSNLRTVVIQTGNWNLGESGVKSHIAI